MDVKGYIKLNYDQIYYLLLIFLALSLPLSIFTTSLAEILLFVNWILDGNYKKKWFRLKERKGAIIISLIYLLHLAGLFYSEDLSYGLHDLKIKLPVLILPLITGSSLPLNERKIRNIILAFSLSVLIGTFVSGAIFFGIIKYPYLDFRDISIFISHIRMALMVVFTIFCLFYYAFISDSEIQLKPWIRRLIIPVILWLIFYLILLKSLTGIIILVITLVVMSWKYSSFIREIAVRFMIRVMIITMPLLILVYVNNSVIRYHKKDIIDFKSLGRFTELGNTYFHDPADLSTENGHYVNIYICEDELREEWNKISEYTYDGKDKKGQELKMTLIRYLTSKNMRKDAQSVKKLTIKDIQAVENGVANHIYLQKYSLYPRIYEIIWEMDAFKRGKDPGGHSVAQRIIYLKAALTIFCQNPILGTGTGDLNKEFLQYYEKSRVIEDAIWWKRAHNQYITFLATFGALGFIVIIFGLFLPPFFENRWNDYLFLCFAFTGYLSMINEDTLETQTGVSFFMFFYSILLFAREKVQQKQMTGKS